MSAVCYCTTLSSTHWTMSPCTAVPYETNWTSEFPSAWLPCQRFKVWHMSSIIHPEIHLKNTPIRKYPYTRMEKTSIFKYSLHFYEARRTRCLAFKSHTTSAAAKVRRWQVPGKRITWQDVLLFAPLIVYEHCLYAAANRLIVSLGELSENTRRCRSELRLPSWTLLSLPFLLDWKRNICFSLNFIELCWSPFFISVDT